MLDVVVSNPGRILLLAPTRLRFGVDGPSLDLCCCSSRSSFRLSLLDDPSPQPGVCSGDEESRRRRRLLDRNRDVSVRTIEGGLGAGGMAKLRLATSSPLSSSVSCSQVGVEGRGGCEDSPADAGLVRSDWEEEDLAERDSVSSWSATTVAARLAT